MQWSQCTCAQVCTHRQSQQGYTCSSLQQQDGHHSYYSYPLTLAVAAAQTLANCLTSRVRPLPRSPLLCGCTRVAGPAAIAACCCQTTRRVTNQKDSSTHVQRKFLARISTVMLSFVRNVKIITKVSNGLLRQATST